MRTILSLPTLNRIILFSFKICYFQTTMRCRYNCVHLHVIRHCISISNPAYAFTDRIKFWQNRYLAKCVAKTVVEQCPSTSNNNDIFEIHIQTTYWFDCTSHSYWFYSWLNMSLYDCKLFLCILFVFSKRILFQTLSAECACGLYLSNDNVSFSTWHIYKITIITISSNERLSFSCQFVLLLQNNKTSRKIKSVFLSQYIPTYHELYKIYENLSSSEMWKTYFKTKQDWRLVF